MMVARFTPMVAVASKLGALALFSVGCSNLIGANDYDDYREVGTCVAPEVFPEAAGDGDWVKDEDACPSTVIANAPFPQGDGLRSLEVSMEGSSVSENCIGATRYLTSQWKDFETCEELNAFLLIEAPDRESVSRIQFVVGPDDSKALPASWSWCGPADTSCKEQLPPECFESGCGLTGDAESREGPAPDALSTYLTIKLFVASGATNALFYLSEVSAD